MPCTSMASRSLDEARRLIADPNLPPKVGLLTQPVDGKAIKQELQSLVDQVDGTPWGAARQMLWDRIDDLKRKLT